MFLFSFTYSATINSSFMAHIAETNPDITLGIAFMASALSVLLLSVIAFPILNGLGPAGFFLFFAIFALGGFLYFFSVLKESKGLSDKEKKKLYRPQKQLTEEDMKNDNYEANIAVSVENLDDSKHNSVAAEEGHGGIKIDETKN